MANRKKNEPFYKKQVGRRWITIFENFNEKKGEVYFSTYISRRYQNRDGVWVEAPFSEGELDDLDRYKEAALEAITQQKAKLSPQQLPQPTDPGFVGTTYEPRIEDAA